MIIITYSLIWNIGMLDVWNNGILNIPIFQYSIIPKLLNIGHKKCAMPNNTILRTKQYLIIR